MAFASVSREPAVRKNPFENGVPGWVPLLLGFLTAVGPISTDIYLPAFPAMEQTFQTDAGNVQMTLSIWFVGLALGQLSVGPLSDRFGRRGPMLVGNFIYAIASAVCAFALCGICWGIGQFGGAHGLCT